MEQKLLREPHRSKRQAEHLANVSTLGDGDLATASPKIEKEHVFVLDAQIRKNAEVNQAPFFESRNDLDSPAGRGFHPFEESARILRVAQRTGRNHPHLFYMELLRGAIEPGEYFDGVR